MALPPRTADTMSDAIALSSPSGRMSKRARKEAEKRLSIALFGPEGLQREKIEISDEDKAKQKMNYAQFLRGLADKGMKPRVHRREAERLELEARNLLSKKEED